MSLARHPLYYRMAQLDLTSEIEVFHLLFERSLQYIISKIAYRILQFPAYDPVGPPSALHSSDLFA